jgi:hypothetical protein
MPKTLIPSTDQAKFHAALKAHAKALRQKLREQSAKTETKAGAK